MATFLRGRITVRFASAWVVLCAILSLSGCSSGKQRLATEQLVVSDSVDRSVAKIDFSPLSGQKVFLETKYMLSSRPPGFVSPEYVISSIRQQMMAYNVHLMDSTEDADLIVEARCGVLGSDGHDSSFGIPGGSAASAAATSLMGTPIPALLPEISLAKRMDQVGATKVAVFAYDRETKEPVWQSGLSTSISTAKDFYVLGIGPIQRGSVYGGTRFVGDPLKPIDPLAIARRLPEQVDPFHNDSQVEPAGFREFPAAPEYTAMHRERNPPQGPPAELAPQP